MTHTLSKTKAENWEKETNDRLNDFETGETLLLKDTFMYFAMFCACRFETC